MFNKMQSFVNNTRHTRQSASTSTVTTSAATNPNLTPSRERSRATSPSPRATAPTNSTTRTIAPTSAMSTYTPPTDPSLSPFSLPGRVSSTRSGDSFDSYDTHDTHGTRFTDDSRYTNGTGYTSDDPRPPDLGAFNTVIREWGYLFGPTARVNREDEDGEELQFDEDEPTTSFRTFSQTSSQQGGVGAGAATTSAAARQTIAQMSGVAIPRPRRHVDTASLFSGESHTGRLSTVWNQQPIADYLRAVSASGDIDLSDVELIAPALLGPLRRARVMSGVRRSSRIMEEEVPAADDTDTEGAQSVVIEHVFDDNSQHGSHESRRGDFTPSIVSLSLASSPAERKAADYVAANTTIDNSTRTHNQVPFPSATTSSGHGTYSPFQFPKRRESPYSSSPHGVPMSKHRESPYSSSPRGVPMSNRRESPYASSPHGMPISNRRDSPYAPSPHGRPMSNHRESPYSSSPHGRPMSNHRESPYSSSPHGRALSENDRPRQQRIADEEVFFDAPERPRRHDEDDLDELELDIMDLNDASRLASGYPSGVVSKVHTHGANTPGYYGRANTSGTLSASRSIVNLSSVSKASGTPGKVPPKNNPHAHLYPTIAHDSDHDDDEEEDEEDENDPIFNHPSHSVSRDPRIRLLAHDIEQEYDSYHEDRDDPVAALSSTIEGPSLGYLDEALNFIAEERARLDKQRAQTAARVEEGSSRFGGREQRERDVFDYNSPENQEEAEGGEESVEQEAEEAEGDGPGGEEGGEQLNENGAVIDTTPRKKRKRKRTRKKSEPQTDPTRELDEQQQQQQQFEPDLGGDGEDVEQGDDESDPFSTGKLAVTKGKQKKPGLIVLPAAITATPSNSTVTGRERDKERVKKSKSVPATPGPAALKQTFLVPAGDTASGYGSPRHAPGYLVSSSGGGSTGRRENAGTATYLSSPYIASAYLSTGTTTTTTTAPNTTDSNSGSAMTAEKKKTRRKRSRAGRSGRSRALAVNRDNDDEDVDVDGEGDHDQREVSHHAKSTPTLRRDEELPLEMHVEDVKVITIPSANEKEARIDTEETTEAVKLRRQVEQIRAQGLEEIRLTEEKKRAEEAVDGAAGKEKKKKKKDKQKADVKVDDASAKLMELTVALARKFGGEKENLVGVYRKLRKEGAARYKEFETRGPGMGMGMMGSEEDEEEWQEEDPDPRGRDPKRGERLVHVFIDHSNILIGLLNYVKKHSHLYAHSNTVNKHYAGHHPQHALSYSSLHTSSHSLLAPASVSISATSSMASTIINPSHERSSTGGSSRPLPPIPVSAKPKPQTAAGDKEADRTPPSTSVALPPALLSKHQTQMAAAASNTPIALPSFSTAAKRLTLDTSNAATSSKTTRGSKKNANAPPPSAISVIPNEKMIEFEGAGAAMDSAPWSTNRSPPDDVLIFDGARDKGKGAGDEDDGVEDALGLVQGNQQHNNKRKQSKRLWHAALALILERGRPITRRVCVASSPLYQPMYTMERLDYEVRIYIRVPDLGDGMDRQAKRNANGTSRKSAAGLKGLHVHRTSGSTSGDGGGYGATYTSSSGNEASGTKALAIKTSQKAGTNNDHLLLSEASSAPASTHVPSPRNQLVHHTNASGYHQPISSSGGSQKVKYREQGVDELLQLKLHQAIAATDEVPEGSTIVLATGDGNVGQFNEDGFLGPVRTALRRGWKVELYAWEEGLSRAWRKEFGPGSEWERSGRFRIVGMEQFAAWLVKDGGPPVH